MLGKGLKMTLTSAVLLLVLAGCQSGNRDGLYTSSVKVLGATEQGSKCVTGAVYGAAVHTGEAIENSRVDEHLYNATVCVFDGTERGTKPVLGAVHGLAVHTGEAIENTRVDEHVYNGTVGAFDWLERCIKAVLK